MCDTDDFRKVELAVGIATSGRREVLGRAIDILSRQTCLPDLLVICPISTDDVDYEALNRFPCPTRVVIGPIGLPAQRNRILLAAKEADIIVFFDDDFFVEYNYLEILKNIFRANPDLVGLTGDLFADGALGPGLSVKQGIEILETQMRIQGDTKPLQGDPDLVDCYGTYGCNMAFRVEAIRNNSLDFDENLPLYGWQEDIDFSRRIARFGRVMRSMKLRGVHLGVKSGRTSGVRLGYSQVANVVYLSRKGSISRVQARRLILRNLIANLLRAFRPEPWIDRKGRLKGNMIALRDWLTGRLSPSQILQLK